MELWRLPNGEVVHNVVTTFEAHSGATRRHPAAKFVTRLYKGDMVRVENSKFGPVVAIVAKFSGDGKIELVPQNEANASDRYRKTKEDLYIRLSAKSAIKSGLRRVVVDEIGRVRDPGPPKL
jgi:CRISPR-associated endonuclease Csn1